MGPGLPTLHVENRDDTLWIRLRAPVGQHLHRIAAELEDASLPALKRAFVVVEDTGDAAALAAGLRVRLVGRPRVVRLSQA